MIAGSIPFIESDSSTEKCTRAVGLLTDSGDYYPTGALTSRLTYKPELKIAPERLKVNPEATDTLRRKVAPGRIQQEEVESFSSAVPGLFAGPSERHPDS